MPTRTRLTGRYPVVGVSGPDGAGKTAAVDQVRQAFAADGIRTRLGHCYGCVLCRRLDRPTGVAGAARARVLQPPTRARRAGTAAGWLGQALRVLHGHLDATELALRLLVLRFATTRYRAAALVTDRGPLDGLAKHDPPPGSRLARRYLRLADRYGVTLLLDAPPEVLARRDGEHDAEELEHWRRLYRYWARRATGTGHEVVVVDTATSGPELVARELVGALAAGTGEVRR
jgi:hypothetical protein